MKETSEKKSEGKKLGSDTRNWFTFTIVTQIAIGVRYV